jgi:hypothetical protein
MDFEYKNYLKLRNCQRRNVLFISTTKTWLILKRNEKEKKRPKYNKCYKKYICIFFFFQNRKRKEEEVLKYIYYNIIIININIYTNLNTILQAFIDYMIIKILKLKWKEPLKRRIRH